MGIFPKVRDENKKKVFELPPPMRKSSKLACWFENQKNFQSNQVLGWPLLKGGSDQLRFQLKKK